MESYPSPWLLTADAALALAGLFGVLADFGGRGLASWAGRVQLALVRHALALPDDDPPHAPLSSISYGDLLATARFLADPALSHPLVSLWLADLLGMLATETHARVLETVALQELEAQLWTVATDADVSGIPPWSAVSAPPEVTP